MGLIDILLCKRPEERVHAVFYDPRLRHSLCGPASSRADEPIVTRYVEPLPPAAVQNVQAQLQQAGVYTGSIDGIWGTDSETALERFQQQHQLQVTEQLKKATAATLGLNPTALLTATEPAPAPPPADHLLPASVRAVQARLGALGFYSGPVDGVWGQGTEAAIEGFQPGARLAAGWATWARDGNHDGAGTGRIGVLLARPKADASSRQRADRQGWGTVIQAGAGE